MPIIFIPIQAENSFDSVVRLFCLLDQLIYFFGHSLHAFDQRFVEEIDDLAGNFSAFISHYFSQRMSLPRVAPVQVHTYQARDSLHQQDLLAVEEPMEIQVIHGPHTNRKKHSLTVTMRTPGHDLELAMGFLLAEGIIHQRAEILEIRHCLQVKSEEEKGNVVRIELAESVELERELLQRNFLTNASCGVCGKASLEGIHLLGCNILPPGLRVDAALIHTLSEKVRSSQTIFSHTGGLHAAALFDTSGNLLHLREDIGRHNALDKLIGAAFEEGLLPLSQHILFLSGRIGFELVQKALVAGIPIVAAVGAPSSLAVRLAQQYQMTMLGFVRNERFNVYSGMERVTASS